MYIDLVRDSKMFGHWSEMSLPQFQASAHCRIGRVHTKTHDTIR
jgi:hypothetical protein